MLLDGSPLGSPWCAEISNAANRPGSNRHSTPDVFRARFALLQRADHLNEHDQARLAQLFATHPRLRAGWEALQELHGLYQADDHDGALEALDRFTDLYATGELGRVPPHSRHHHRRGATRSWPGTVRAGPPTAESKAPTTSSKSYAASPTVFTNPNNFAARGLLVT